MKDLIKKLQANDFATLGEDIEDIVAKKLSDKIKEKKVIVRDKLNDKRKKKEDDQE